MSTQKSIRFWDRIAERYARRPVADEATYQEKLRVTREHLQPDMRVLEFGCGTGSTAIEHAPYVNHILATDISPKMIEIAKAKAALEESSNVDFACTSIEDLEIEDESMDAVLALNILHLVEDRRAVLAKTYRVLKPGGILVSSTACIGDSMKFFKFIAPIGRFLRLIPPVSVFTKADLERDLSDTGFTVDHQWTPGKGMAVFIVSSKGGNDKSSSHT